MNNPYLEQYKSGNKPILVIGKLSLEMTYYIEYLNSKGIKILTQDDGTLNPDDIGNVVIIDENGPIISDKGKIVSVSSLEALSPDIKTQRNQVVSQITELLEKGHKRVSLVGTDGLQKELETLIGAGTMFIDFSNATFGTINNPDLFEMIYAENVANGDWKERSQDEKNKIFKNYIVLEIDGCVLGGYQLVDFSNNGENGFLIQCLWCSKQGSGVGNFLVENIKKQNKNRKVFAYSKQEAFFTKMGFSKVEGVFSKTGAQFYVFN